MKDRRLHAEGIEGHAAIVRYERAGKWYCEFWDGRRHHLTLSEAVADAVEMYVEGGVICFDIPGGSSFDRRVRALLDRTIGESA